jgi:hypothetical protein
MTTRGDSAMPAPCGAAVAESKNKTAAGEIHHAVD